KINKCINHLSTVENFNIDTLKEESKYIDDLYKVRNEIVHNSGILTKKLNKLNIKKLKGSIGGVIEISFEFLDFYLQKIKLFFNKLKDLVAEFISKNA
ncbi:MAG: hypothetical protein JKX76_08755, partial [Colwellia sp.]|nr:hypothetical protein [Colwellia sp.]